MQEHSTRFAELNALGDGQIGMAIDDGVDGTPIWVCVVAKGVAAACVERAVKLMAKEAGFGDISAVRNRVN